MLQDLSVGKLENEFYNLEPKAGDLVICFHENQVLLKKAEDGSFLLPTVDEVSPLTEGWDHWYESGFRYVFRIRATNFFLWLGNADA